MKFTLALFIALTLITGAPGTAAQEIDPDTRDKIDELIQLTQVEAMTAAIGPQMIEPLLRQYEALNPGREAEVKELVSERFKAFMGGIVEAMLPGLRRFLAENFTNTEIDELLVLQREYMSQPVVIKMIGLAPKMQQQMMQDGFMQNLMAQSETFAEELVAELSAAGLKSPTGR